MTIYVLITAIAVAAKLWAEYVGSRRGIWVFKPLASTGFLLSAWSAGAMDTPYGRALFVGLVLAWLGDVLLIPRDRPLVFKAGVVSFLLGHIAYAAAFWMRGLDTTAALVAAIVVAAVGFFIFRGLGPRIPARMRAVARAYVVVISAMVVAAAGSVAAAGNLLVLVGASAFYASDISVARDRFVEPAFVNKLWGTPLYYAAQLVLASTVS